MSALNDSAFLRMFIIILGALVAFTVLIIVVANLIPDRVGHVDAPDPRQRAAVAERIKPVGTVNVGDASAAPAGPASGADVVASTCNSCHGSGVLDAPKIGDQGAWAARLAAQGGLDGLTASAIAGKGAMPARGGAAISDEEVRGAVEHMLKESNVELPDAPTQAGPDAADAAQSMAAAGPGMVPPAAAPAFDLAKGEAVYNGACFACHATGAAGAPKIGDAVAWQGRIAQGMDALIGNAINGKNGMPPRGGRMDLSNDDVAAATAYIVEMSK